MKENFKKPVALLLFDTHITNNNHEVVQSIFIQALNVCKEKNVYDLVIGGDIFTTRQNQSLLNLLFFKSIINIICSENINLHVIAGNHDKTDQSVNDSYLSIFYNKNLYLYDDYDKFLVINNNFYMWFLPYFVENIYLSKLNMLKKMVKEHNKKYNVLISHHAVNGVVNNDGTVVENNIKRELFNDFNKVFVGHYHNKSEIFPNIHYCGSTHAQKFGENDEKGFTLLYSDASFEYINSDFPKYIKIECDFKDLPNLYSELDVMYKNGMTKKENIRLIFKGKPEEFAGLDLNEIKRKGFDVKFENTRTIININKAKNNEFKAYSKNSIIDEFILFCKENNINAKKVDIGLNYIKELQ